MKDDLKVQVYQPREGLFRLVDFRKEDIEIIPDACVKYVDYLRRVEALKMVLRLAKEKLIIFRENSNGIYEGGTEYAALMRIIKQALNEEESAL